MFCRQCAFPHCSPCSVTRWYQSQMVGLLVERFKLTTFKDWQLRTIKALINVQDALVVQSTGSGKSLCFQFPAAWLKKTTIIITPTISQALSIIPISAWKLVLKITMPDDYQYLWGLLPTWIPSESCILPGCYILYDETNDHFLLDDIQLGKGNYRT